MLCRLWFSEGGMEALRSMGDTAKGFLDGSLHEIAPQLVARLEEPGQQPLRAVTATTALITQIATGAGAHPAAEAVMRNWDIAVEYNPLFARFRKEHPHGLTDAKSRTLLAENNGLYSFWLARELWEQGILPGRPARYFW